jgi:hypothetical protein
VLDFGFVGASFGLVLGAFFDDIWKSEDTKGEVLKSCLTLRLLVVFQVEHILFARYFEMGRYSDYFAIFVAGRCSGSAHYIAFFINRVEVGRSSDLGHCSGSVFSAIASIIVPASLIYAMFIAVIVTSPIFWAFDNAYWIRLFAIDSVIFPASQIHAHDITGIVTDHPLWAHHVAFVTHVTLAIDSVVNEASEIDALAIANTVSDPELWAGIGTDNVVCCMTRIYLGNGPLTVVTRRFACHLWSAPTNSNTSAITFVTIAAVGPISPSFTLAACVIANVVAYPVLIARELLITDVIISLSGGVGITG